MLVEKSFQTESSTLNYAEGPDSGPPLVLLHGITANWTMYMPLMATLSQRWHIYAPDFPGHGKSSRLPGQYSLLDYAEDTSQFVRSNFDEPPAIFGSSLGGMVGILVAARHPELVRALIVGDSPLYKETVAEILEKRGDDVGETQDQIRSISSVDEMASAIQELTAARQAAFQRWLAKSYTMLDPAILELHINEEYDGESLLPEISCPVLLLQASLMADGDVERALGQLQKGYVVRFPEMDHILNLEPQGYQVVNAAYSSNRYVSHHRTIPLSCAAHNSPPTATACASA